MISGQEDNDMEPITTDNTLYTILLNLERRSLEMGTELPREEEKKAIWSGVAFSVGNHRLLASLRDVQEVLDCPPLTHIPRTQKWLKGIANVRGRLLPVIDLEIYLGGNERPVQGNSQILVVQYGALSAGLLVETVWGQQHFMDEDSCPLPVLDGAGVAEYVRPIAYRSQEGTWLVFDVRKLVTSPQFMQVVA